MALSENITEHYGCFAYDGNYGTTLLMEIALFPYISTPQVQRTVVWKKDLKDFSDKHYAPADMKDTFHLWECLFELLHGLKCIQTVKSSRSTDPQIFQGYVSPQARPSPYLFSN